MYGLYIGSHQRSWAEEVGGGQEGPAPSNTSR